MKNANRFTGQKMKVLNYDDELLPEDPAELETYLKDADRYGVVDYRDKTDPSKSWAIPFVTGHKYKAHWGIVGLDWDGMKMQMSERWSESDKPIYMVHNFTEQRHAIEVDNRGQEITNDTWIESWDPSGATKYDLGQHIVINESFVDPTLALTDPDAAAAAEETTSEQGNKFIKYIISGKAKTDT